MIDGYGQLCPECGDPYIGGPGCYAGACAAEPDEPFPDMAWRLAPGWSVATGPHHPGDTVTEPDYARVVRVLVVVNWRRGRVHGITCDQATAQQWTRQLVARYDGDPLAATLTVDLVYPDSPPVPFPEETPR